MKKRTGIVVVAISCASIVGGYLWLSSERPGSAPAGPIVEAQPIDVPAVKQDIAPSIPPAVPQEVAASGPVPPVPMPDIQSILNSPPRPRPGYDKVVDSQEFQTYLVFLDISNYSDPAADGHTIGPDALKRFQQEYDLSDQELQKLVEYSRLAVKASKDNQAMLTKELCARKDQFRTVEEFGVAMNQRSAAVLAQQETLGREAQSQLGTELFNKIIGPIQYGRPHESIHGDFAVIYRERGEDLATVLGRFCRPRG